MQRIENMMWRERRISPDNFDRSVDFLEGRLKNDLKDIIALGNLASMYNHRARSDHELASDYAQKVLSIDPEDKGDE